MERRYSLLKANYVRSIHEFNKKVRDGQVLRRAEPKGPDARWILLWAQEPRRWDASYIDKPPSTSIVRPLK